MTEDELAVLHNCLLTAATQLSPTVKASEEEWKHHRDAKGLLEKPTADVAAGLAITEADAGVLRWAVDLCLGQFDDADLSTLLGTTRQELSRMSEALATAHRLV